MESFLRAPHREARDSLHPSYIAEIIARRIRMLSELRNPARSLRDRKIPTTKTKRHANSRIS